MTLGFVAFLLGLFGVPIALLAYGHRLRRRPARGRRAFWGAIVGHCVAGVLAVVLGMIPPEEWTSDETARGLAGYWALLLLPVAGAALGAATANSPNGRRALALAALAAIPGCRGGTAARQAASAEPTRPPFVAAVGHWTAVDDGGPAFRVDGERWDGTSDRAALDGVARSLFAAPTETFVTNGAADGAFPLAVFRDAPDFSGGTLRVRFKLVGGKSDQTAGIVLGLQPNGEYVFVRYNTKDGNAAVWRYADGERRVLAHGAAHAQLPLDVWHELAVTVSGTKITGVVNGDSLRVEHTLDKPITGRVGLWTKRDAVTVFRDFRVTP